MVPGGKHFAQLHENYRDLRGNVEKVVSEQHATLLKFVEEKKVLRKELEQSEARQKELEKELVEYGIRMVLIEKELEQSGVQKQELKKEVEKSEAERAELSKQLEKNEAYNNAIKKEVTQKLFCYELQLKDHQILLEQSEARKRELEEKETRMQYLGEELECKEAQKQEIKEELEKSKAKKEELSEKLEQIEARNTELQNVVVEQETSLLKNEQQLKDHKNFLGQSEDRKKKLEKELEEKETHMQYLEKELERKESEKQDLKEELMKSETKKEELSVELAQNEAHSKELEKVMLEQGKTLLNYEQELKDQKNFLEQREARKKELEKELDKLRDLREHLKNEVLQQNTKLLKSEDKVKDFKSKLENRESENKELKQELETNKRKRELEQQEMQLQKMNGRAILAKDMIDRLVPMLAEEQKLWHRERDELQRKIKEMETLFKQHEKHLQQMGEIQQQCLENEEAAHMDALNAEAFVKEHKSYAELLDFRLQLINSTETPITTNVSGKSASTASVSVEPRGLNAEPLISGKTPHKVKLLDLSTAEAIGDKSTAASPITVGQSHLEAQSLEHPAEVSFKAVVEAKRLRVEPGDPMDEDHLTLSEALKNRKKVKNVDKGSNGENLSAPDKYVATSVANESSVNTMMLESSRKDIVLSKPLFWVGNGSNKKRGRPFGSKNKKNAVLEVTGGNLSIDASKKKRG